MSGSRFVLLGLEAAGSPWPAALSSLLASRDPDDEYLPCDGPADLLARLATGRRFSAVVVDHRTSGLNRVRGAVAEPRGCP